MIPEEIASSRLQCPSGFVLGEDELCYPKAILRRSSRFRKWKPGMRPVMTGGERRGITKARETINRARVAIGMNTLSSKKKSS